MWAKVQIHQFDRLKDQGSPAVLDFFFTYDSPGSEDVKTVKHQCLKIGKNLRSLLIVHRLFSIINDT